MTHLRFKLDDVLYRNTCCRHDLVNNGINKLKALKGLKWRRPQQHLEIKVLVEISSMRMVLGKLMFLKGAIFFHYFVTHVLISP